MQIKLIKSSFYKEEETKKKLCDFIFGAKTLSMGEECKKFEENFSKFQQRKYSVFVNSGSSANLILIQTLLNKGKIKKGDSIGVSALTWATNIMPLIELGLNPVLVDCDIDTLNISIDSLKSKNISALFITNVLGFSSNMIELTSYCNQRKILLIEDNCESLGTRFKDKLLGNFGLASTFSFFVGHHLSTIEGGMVCTDDFELYEGLIMSRAHGWARNLSDGSKLKLRQLHNIEPFYEKYAFYDLGYNLRPTEINGFIGNEQLKYINSIIDNREKNYKYVEKSMNENDDLIHLNTSWLTKFSSFAIPFIFKDEKVRDKYLNYFESSGIETRPIISGNMQKQPFFKKYVSEENVDDCPNSDFIHRNGFYIGNNPEMTKEELDVIVSAIKGAKNYIPDETYKKIIEHVPICSVDTVIISKDLKSVLLFKRKNEPMKNVYYTLGGRLMKDEEPIDGAIRKIGEEIGIKVDKSKLTFSGMIYEKFDRTYFSDTISSNYVNLFFVHAVDKNNFKFFNGYQHLDSKWFSIDDESQFHPYVRQKIKGAIISLKGKPSLNE